MAQPVTNYQPVMVSKTLYKRLVHAGALCSECLLPADIHGGYGPCGGAFIILDAEIIRRIQVNYPLPTEAELEKNSQITD